MGRTNPRVLAALAITARQVIDALATTITVEKKIYAAIDRVAAFARGEKIGKAELKQLRASIDKLAEGKRDWKTPQRKDYHWAVGVVATLAHMAESGADYKQLALDHLSYGLAEQGKTKGRPNESFVETWFAAALKQNADVSDATIAKKVNAKAAEAEAKALAPMKKALGKKAALLATARWSKKRAGSPTELKALLAKKKLEASRAVLAFDAVFGGLRCPDDDSDDWFETDAGFHVGAFACAKLQPTAYKEAGVPGLVPIIVTPNDNIAFLDAKGAVWAMDTIEDETAVKIKGTPAQLIAKMLENA